MNINESQTLLDKFNSSLKNNPLFALILLLGSFVIALSTFTNASKNLWSFFKTNSRAEVNGNWQAEVVYDWPKAKYAETFSFSGDGEELTGTASFLKVKRGVLEGKIQGNKLEFVTKTAEVSGASGPQIESVHRYQGNIAGNKISFIMQTTGGNSAHIPIEFTATRVE